MSIEKIRAEVEEVRRDHRTYDPYPSGALDPHCRECGCNSPCHTLRLAEKMLKLAHAIELVSCGQIHDPQDGCWWCVLREALAEVAGDDATRHEPDPDAGILGSSPEEWERSTRRGEEEW